MLFTSTQSLCLFIIFLIVRCFLIPHLSPEEKNSRTKKMTEEIQCTRSKYLLHEFPEDQEHQSSLFVFFFALTVIILAWKQETILIPQFGWNFLHPMHILGCRGRCLPLCILHNLPLQKTTIITMGTFTLINFLHALLTRDDGQSILWRIHIYWSPYELCNHGV